MSDYDGIYDGTVVSNADPEGRYRVKVRVPGKCEPESGWALPYGTIGGGSPNRGGFLAPDVGAIVGVCFANKDPDKPRYFCGWWPKGTLPEESDSGNPDVFAMSLGGARFTLKAGENGRGFAKLGLIPPAEGVEECVLQMDGETFSVILNAVTECLIKALGQVKIDPKLGCEVFGRPIMAKPGIPLE